MDGSELSEVFDRVLLCTAMKGEPACCNVDEQMQNEATKTSQQNGQPHESQVVDLKTSLINCAQSVAADGHMVANEQLKQIRQHTSPFSDGSQRVAYVFASGLEVRLADTGSQIYATLASKRITAAELLKAFQLYHSACPFQKILTFLANKMILDLAMNNQQKASCYCFWKTIVNALMFHFNIMP